MKIEVAGTGGISPRVLEHVNFSNSSSSAFLSEPTSFAEYLSTSRSDHFSCRSYPDNAKQKKQFPNAQDPKEDCVLSTA
jgi:hypothetical protein